MTTISIILDDELAARLRDEAQNLGVAPEELARRGVENLLAQNAETATIDEITTRVFARRRSAYEKLAEGVP